MEEFEQQDSHSRDLHISHVDKQWIRASLKFVLSSFHRRRWVQKVGSLNVPSYLPFPSLISLPNLSSYTPGPKSSFYLNWGRWKWRTWKCRTWNWRTMQFAGHLQGVKLQDTKLQDSKYSVNRDYITLQCAISGCCYFLRHKHSNALCASYNIFTKSVTYYLF